MNSEKIMAVIAKLMRKSGFKGKIEPHLGECAQLNVSSAVYSDLIYSVRMEGDIPTVYVYKLVDGVWKPVRKSGVIFSYKNVSEFEESINYLNYYQYFSYYQYDKFSSEFKIIEDSIDKVIEAIRQNNDH